MRGIDDLPGGPLGMLMDDNVVIASGPLGRAVETNMPPIFVREIMLFLQTYGRSEREHKSEKAEKGGNDRFACRSSQCGVTRMQVGQWGRLVRVKWSR